MMKSPSAVLVVAAMLLVVLLPGGASAASCNARQLKPCVPALTTGVMPTAECCSNMRAQESCLCQFAKNPAYARYIGKPTTRRTITNCGISLPHCSST